VKSGLGIYGLEVITASHGIDALRQFNAHKGTFRAIVTDNDMPHMNGLEFIRSVREIGFKCRIVVISSHLGIEDLQAYQEYAVSDFFQKPFEMRLLVATLLKTE